MHSQQRVFLVVAKDHISNQPAFVGVTLLVVGAYHLKYRLDGFPTSMDPFYYVRNMRHTFFEVHWDIKELPPL